MRTSVINNTFITGILSLAFLMTPVFVFAVGMDTDADGLTDEMEAYYYTDPTNPDTDGDGFLDGIEVEYDYSPHIGDEKKMGEFDFDNDGLNDWLERWFQSDIGVEDTDGDGFTDYEEVMKGSVPTSAIATNTFGREIVVDRSAQRVYYFTDGVKIHNFPASTGNPETETPAGEFSMIRKVQNKRYVGPGYDLSGVKWNVEFLPMYYLHTAYWHNDFGKRTRSHGCVNLREVDAKTIYDYIDESVSIRVVGDTPKGFFVGT